MANLRPHPSLFADGRRRRRGVRGRFPRLEFRLEPVGAANWQQGTAGKRDTERGNVARAGEATIPIACAITG